MKNFFVFYVKNCFYGNLGMVVRLIIKEVGILFFVYWI